MLQTQQIHEPSSTAIVSASIFRDLFIWFYVRLEKNLFHISIDFVSKVWFHTFASLFINFNSLEERQLRIKVRNST
jgi:hypothetical protein